MRERIRDLLRGRGRGGARRWPWSRAVITGGGGGIGRQLALALAAPGVRVVVADIDPAAAERAAGEVVTASGAGADALAVACDVRDADSMVELARRADAWMGGPDLVVNNAGVLVAGPLLDMTLAEYRRVIDINLWGVIHGCHAFVPDMARRGGGHVINVASMAGPLALPMMGAYAATKAAVIALSEALHAELAGAGVGVTVLCPSFTRTRLVTDATGPDGGAPRSELISRADSLMSALGQDPATVARCALSSAARGALYAVPAAHARAAWRAKRLAPERFKRAMALVHRQLAPPRHRA